MFRVPEDAVALIDHNALWLINTLRDAGYESVLVGGCVRDLLRGEQPSDFDIATAALPEETVRLFSNYPLIRDGEKHGTVAVILHRKAYEITTYRIDGRYTDVRHPDTVTFTPDLQADLSRRDFTVNAMAMYPDGTVFDPFDGITDLQQGVLRCVGEPGKRFAEDALRILRALRFSAVLGFPIAPETDRALRSLAHTMSNVARERVTAEFLKLICGRHAPAVWHTYGTVIASWIGLPAGEIPTLPEHMPADPGIRLAVLFRDTAEAEQITLCLSNALRRRIHALLCIKQTPPRTRPEARRAIGALPAEVSPETAAEYLQVLGLETAAELMRQTAAAGDCCRVKDLKIDGTTLQELGIPKGREVGRILQLLLDLVMDGRLENTPSALRSAVGELVEKQLR